MSQNMGGIIEISPIATQISALLYPKREIGKNFDNSQYF